MRFLPSLGHDTLDLPRRRFETLSLLREATSDSAAPLDNVIDGPRGYCWPRAARILGEDIQLRRDGERWLLRYT